MRRQRRVELRRVVVRKFDPVTAARVVGGRGDRTLGPRIGARFGLRSRFQLDRGTQLVHRGDRGQLRVMLIRSLACVCGDHPNLIGRQATLSQAGGAAGKLRQPASNRGQRVRVCRRTPQLPGHQRRHRARPGHTAQLVAVDLGHDLHNAPVDRIALTTQLRQLLEQHLKAVTRSDHHGLSGRDRRHDHIITATTDKTGPPIPIREPSQARAPLMKRVSSSSGAGASRPLRRNSSASGTPSSCQPLAPR